jgi:hypothetical protein
MTFEEHRTTVVHESQTAPPEPAAVDDRRVYADDRVVDNRVVHESEVAAVRPSGSTVAARLVAMVFGLIQLDIALRIVFLLLNAREGNALVSAVLDLSRPLVAPFEGIFQTNALQAGGTILDIAAIAALIGWTVIELIVLGFMRVRRPGEDV